MRSTFNIKPMVAAIAALSIASLASAAGLDRSGQDVSAFLQDGTYAEAVYTYIDADVTGYDNKNLNPLDLKAYEKGNKIKDIAEDYDFFRYGVKTDINDKFSVGVLYDEPFGASADYTGNNNFVSDGDADAVVQSLTKDSEQPLQSFAQAQGAFAQLAGAAQSFAQQAAEAVAAGETEKAAALAQQAAGFKAQAEKVGAINLIAGGVAASKGEETKVEVRTENITGLIGYKANENFQIYGGPVIQRTKADVALRGPAYATTNGYSAHVSPDDGYGWIAGFAFSKPEIALKAALTYRSEIDHTNSIDEQFSAGGGQASKIDITTPESVNFDFQTGVNPTTLATAKVRWVPWSDFAITPPAYNESTKRIYPEGLDLVAYDDDQWQVELGLAKRLTPALAVSGTVGWDSGAGDPTTSLGPIEGYYSVGAGAKYNLDENWAISAGGKYLMFGDAKGQLPNGKVVSKFEDNDGFALGVKVSYQDK